MQQEKMKVDEIVRGLSMTNSLPLPYPVALNRAYRNFRGRMVMSAEGRAWKQHAAWAAKAAGWKVIAGPVWVTLTLHPKLTKTGRASETRMDLDAIFKLALDSFNGVAYLDDKQVRRIVAEIGYPVKDGGLSVSVGGL